jgi:hypothetical protein
MESKIYDLNSYDSTKFFDQIYYLTSKRVSLQERKYVDPARHQNE